MLKAQLQNRRIAEQEMVSEAGILARLKHPNIINIVGSGSEPRKFIVLELLQGGTLSELLYPEAQDGAQSNVVASVESSAAAPFILPSHTIVFIAREIAKALHYLHNEIDPNMMIIHRGLL